MEDLADSLSVQSDEITGEPNLSYPEPNLQQEAQSMEVLRQELVHQLEVAGNRSDWEAAQMYRDRLS